MYSKYVPLSQLQPAQLDLALAAGWFRMQQTLFTTQTLQFEGIFYPVIWLRIRLEDFEPDKTYWKIKKRADDFRVEISKAVLTKDHEKLFSAYKRQIPFEAASSLRSLLFGEETINVFETCFINLYEGNKLIACGGFDLGFQSAAGIFSVYDPAYSQFSLGKFLIYEKMLFCKRKGLSCFYPGYYVPGYARFDYKKEIGKGAIEYFDPAYKRWYPLPE